MRICLLTRYFNFRNAGIGRVSVEILKGLRERGHEVHTISTEGDSLYSYFRYTAFEIPKRLPKGYDIYHALTPMEGMWLPKDRSVVTYHDLIPMLHPDLAGAGLNEAKWKLLVGRNYFKLACAMASKGALLVCTNKKTRSEVVRYLKAPSDKVRVVKLGIDSSLEPQERKDETLRIGYLGQLDRRKRVDLLISAYKSSSLTGELLIGGAGADEEELRSLAGEDPRIKFYGFVPEHRLADFYNSLDVLVFPTGIEGYGLPLVEAMACKRPAVVLSDAIIPPEVRNRCYTFSSLESFFASEDSLRRWLRKVKVEDSYAWAKTHCWSRCVDEYVELYEEVVRQLRT